MLRRFPEPSRTAAAVVSVHVKYISYGVTLPYRCTVLSDVMCSEEYLEKIVASSLKRFRSIKDSKMTSGFHNSRREANHNGIDVKIILNGI